MQLDTLKSLYIATLKDMHDGESQLANALAVMAKNASHSSLKGAFSEHSEETREHRKRLEKLLASLHQEVAGGKCHGIRGIILEGQRLIQDHSESVARDAGLIATAQQAAHVEIATYGALCSYAEMLGRRKDVKLLKETLCEDKTADSTLKGIARKAVNPNAVT